MPKPITPLNPYSTLGRFECDGKWTESSIGADDVVKVVADDGSTAEYTGADWLDVWRMLLAMGFVQTSQTHPDLTYRNGETLQNGVVIARNPNVKRKNISPRTVDGRKDH